MRYLGGMGLQSGFQACLGLLISGSHGCPGGGGVPVEALLVVGTGREIWVKT